MRFGKEMILKFRILSNTFAPELQVKHFTEIKLHTVPSITRYVPVQTKWKTKKYSKPISLILGLNLLGFHFSKP